MRTFGYFLLVGWIIAFIHKIAVGDWGGGVPYTIGWLLSVAIPIWLIRRKPKKTMETKDK
jgi:hypothetical protein